jgi:hypothetical protein
MQYLQHPISHDPEFDMGMRGLLVSFKVRITGDKGVWGRLRGFGRIDFKPIVQDIAKVIVDDNRTARNLGVDMDNKALPAVITPNYKRGGSGPPTVPRKDSSRTIKNFKVVPRKSGGSWVLDCVWEGCDYMRYWTEKYRIFGVRPQAKKKIKAIIVQFMRKRFGRI